MSVVMGMQNVIKNTKRFKGSEFERRQNLDLTQISFDNLIGYILSISMYMQNFITIFFTVLEIGPFSLFQNSEFGKASSDKNVSSQSLGPDLVIINVYAMCMQKFIKIFHSVQKIGPFSLFQNLALGKALTNDKCHFSIPWARSFQHQIVCKILLKYSKRFNS